MNKIIAYILSALLICSCTGCKKDISTTPIEPSSSISSSVSSEPIIDADPIIPR